MLAVVTARLFGRLSRSFFLHVGVGLRVRGMVQAVWRREKSLIQR
jgi:hypothetical protein